MAGEIRRSLSGVALVTLMAWAAEAELPQGSPSGVEAEGSPSAVALPTAASAPGPDSRPEDLTRAAILAEIESIDPTLWLRAFGAVQTRLLSPSE